ncbi:MAG: DUF4258 domain-containing protein [Anaerolineae bacterium]|nr:MAG: DUF4258 domain-containing protein [Anaerolineae bacterium]
METDRLQFRAHAVQRMFERGISVDEVLALLREGEIIEDYTADMPAPGELRLGWAGARPLHAVFAFDAARTAAVVVTAYEPSLADWGDTFRQRRA